MQDSNDILRSAVVSIEAVTTFFYQQKEKEGYEKLDGTLTAIGLAMNEIHKQGDTNERFFTIERNINSFLNNAMEALTIKDSILLADILLYEVAEQFRSAMDQ
jgi:hypothetical protein